MEPHVYQFSIEQAALVGIVTGVFSAGTIYGILRTELKNLREDVTELKGDFKRHILDSIGGK